MGSSRIKKPKAGKVSVDVMNNIVTRLNELRDFANVQNTLNNDIVDAIIELKRVKPAPLDTSKVSQDLIDAIKYAKPNPVMDSTPRQQARQFDFANCVGKQQTTSAVPICGHFACIGVNICKYPPQPTPKVSTWRNNEERCIHLFKAVESSLKYFSNIKLQRSITTFNLIIRLPYLTKLMIVNITTNTIELRFADKNGESRTRTYHNTTEAAADIVGLAVFYSLKS